MNYGILLALDGRSVRGSSSDLALDSNLQTLNMKVDAIDPNSGVINVTFNTAGTTAGLNTLIFRKVLDPTYPQFFYFSFNQAKSTKSLAAQYGNIWGLDPFNNRYFKVTKTDNVVEFRYVTDPGYIANAGDSLAGYFFQFQFAFYINPAV